MHFAEGAIGFDHLAHRAAGGRVGRDRGADGDAAVLGDLGGDIADAADVDVAMLFREAKLGRQVLAHHVAVEQRHRAAAHFHQLDHQRVGDGRFARARQAGEPQHRRLLVLHRRMLFAGDVDRLPVHVLRAAQAEVDHARGDGRIGDLVDQDEAAQLATVGIGCEGQRLVGCQFDDTDAVQLEGLRRKMLEAVDVDLELGLLDRGAHHLRGQLEPVAAARNQVFLAHPDQVRLELVGILRRIVGGCDDRTARHVDLVGQRQRD